MLGHASAAMTLDVYADLFDSDLISIAESVGKMCTRQAQPNKHSIQNALCQPLCEKKGGAPCQD
jgi:hypothetical protein